jgi:hypothetical protein
MRASDADRERTVELLREHHAVGRLSAEEFHDRLNDAYAARTLGDLNALLADLPAIDLYRLPAAGISPVRRGGGSLDRRGGGALLPAYTMPWVAWAATTAVLVALWVVVGVASGGAAAWIPWFLLVVIPWRIALQRRRPPEP